MLVWDLFLCAQIESTTPQRASGGVCYEPFNSKRSSFESAKNGAELLRCRPVSLPVHDGLYASEERRQTRQRPVDTRGHDPPTRKARGIESERGAGGIALSDAIT